MIRAFRFIIVCLFFVIASCNEKQPANGPVDRKNENILRFDVAAPFKLLNPAASDASGSTVIFPLLYSYLFVPDVDGNLEPDLAIKWRYDPETFTWIIQLRSDAVFHNQAPVTSSDVKYSIETILRNLQPGLFSSIHSISVLTDNTVNIALNHEDAGFLEKIWYVEIMPQSGGVVGQGNTIPVGSGPFQFESRSGKEKIVLRKNKKYYNAPPSLDKVMFFYEPDKEKSWTRLLAGATDIAQEISPKNFEIMKQYENRFYFDHYTLRFYSLILYNTHDPLFSDSLVRRALTSAIDREYIVRNLLNGYGKVAAGPMGVDSPFHNPDVKPLPYDPAGSLKMLHQAGWRMENDGYIYKDGKIFEFTLMVMEESQIEKKIAQYIKLCFNDIGIKMHINVMPYKETTSKYVSNNAFQAVFTEFSGAYHRPEFLKDLWVPQQSKKSWAGGFENSDVTRLLNNAFSEKDPVKQKNCLCEVDALVASLQPGTFLFHKTAIDVMSKRFYLQFPFSLSYPGIFRLQKSSLIQN